jgi:hypothetical protein
MKESPTWWWKRLMTTKTQKKRHGLLRFLSHRNLTTRRIVSSQNGRFPL